ncbi:MAG: (Fe-S)-binding protein [Desulfobacteraceae bacterium]|nr:(Fe-S)-binding protein [Desulfobacteraceae bacterium]
MQDMRKLAELVKQLEDQLATCMRCGMCQAVCPVFAETGRETDVTRGKLALLDGLIREVFKEPSGVNERLTHCLLCGSCAANCPSGVQVLDIFLKARAILTAYMGLNPVKRLIFRGLLANPGFFDRFFQLASGVQGLFIKPASRYQGTSCARISFPLGNRHFNALAPVAFHNLGIPVNSAPGKSGIRVGFFTGCVLDKIYPRIGQAVVRSLDHHEVGSFVPRNQACCGIPALASGDTASFDRLVRHNLEVFAEEGLDYIVTACATCTSTIKKLWPAMAGEFSDRERSRLDDIAGRTLDISQFLIDVVGVNSVSTSQKDDKSNLETITYHDPCHLKKSLGVSAQPRALISANPRYRFAEMAEADRCCGCGGSFNLQHYDISLSIGRRKRDNIVASKSSVVATGCPACMLQIGDVLSQAGDPVQVRHVIEIYADSFD